MSSRVDRFAPRSNDDLMQLVRQQPLAWVVSGSAAADDFRATLLPILVERDTDGSIARLVGMEGQTTRAGASPAWKVDDMGARYASLSRGVIGFRANVRNVRAKFKLGQDERDDVFRDIMVGLGHGDSAELQAWMQAFNPSRG